jgi:hypothetical protein
MIKGSKLGYVLLALWPFFRLSKSFLDTERPYLIPYYSVYM